MHSTCMTDHSDSGVSLKNDIASILTDSTFHDVVLVCSDGVEIGACRAILASRSVVFKAMLYGYMKESISDRVSFQNIKSTAMHAVLRFIHTEDIDSNADSIITIETYHAANFFLLPKLMELVFDRVHNITDFSIATSLLNDVIVSVPLNDNTGGLFDAVFKPFCVTSLAIGNLNGLSDKALELLLTHTASVEFKTSEYRLLLCVIEWAWARDTTALPADERRAIFDDINNLSMEPSINIRLQSEPSRQSLLNLLDHFDLDLVCPHRLKCLIKSINVFDELPRITWTFCYHACKNVKCSPVHPSRFRGKPKLQLDRHGPVSGLVFSEKDTVLEYPIATGSNQIVRASTKCSADCDGISEWTIIIESLASDDSAIMGLIESWNDTFEDAGWCIRLYSNWTGEIFSKGTCTNVDYGFPIKIGDVITFHLDLNNHTCTLSVNERNCGVAWHDLPHVNLYPAVGLCPGAKYRIEPCQ